MMIHKQRMQVPTCLGHGCDEAPSVLVLCGLLCLLGHPCPYHDLGHPYDHDLSLYLCLYPIFVSISTRFARVTLHQNDDSVTQAQQQRTANTLRIF